MNLLTYPRSLTTTSIAIAQTGLLLFVVEYLLLAKEGKTGYEWALAAITMLPMLFYAVLARLELQVTERKRRAGSGTLVGAYMLFKGLRLVLTIFTLAIYIYCAGPLLKFFVANIVILFLLALLLTSLCHYRAERSA